ncbi:MAG: hypothetical protein LBL62_03435 [Planctomycetaceae bacterium]|nr:hypothetical protein [Planctomycetaceae bacterium]
MSFINVYFNMYSVLKGHCVTTHRNAVSKAGGLVLPFQGGGKTYYTL